MSDRHVRAGLQQAKIADTGLGWVGAECLILALGLGLGLHSWGAGLIGFIVLFALMALLAQIEAIGTAAAWLIGLFWAWVAGLLARGLEAAPLTVAGVSIVVFLLAAGAHVAGFRAIRDLNRARG